MEEYLKEDNEGQGPRARGPEAGATDAKARENEATEAEAREAEAEAGRVQGPRAEGSHNERGRAGAEASTIGTYIRQGLISALLSGARIRGARLLLMLSGGADSMVLLHFLLELKAELGFELAAFSLDHMFRKEASYQDLLFVRAEAEKRGIRLHSYRRDVGARARELGIGDELCARKTRYNLAHSLRLCYGYDYIISAHHRSDAVESLFLHFIRGSGLGGLRGIAEVDGPVLRPLLFAPKAAIMEAARRLNIPYREDETNSENHYSRNYLRNEILPRLERLNPNLEASLMRTAALIREEDDFLEELAMTKLEELSLGRLENASEPELKMELDLPNLKACHLALRRRIFLHLLRRELGRVDVYSSIVEELIRLIETSSGKRLEFRGLVFEMERDRLIIRKPRTRTAAPSPTMHYGFNEIGGLRLVCELASFKKGRIYLLDHYAPPCPHQPSTGTSPHDLSCALSPPLPASPPTAPYLPSEDAGLLDYLLIPSSLFEEGLHLRQRRPEDVIRPRRLKGSTRKVKKLLNDYKIPRYRREELLYLASPFEVLWILGIEKTFEHDRILYHSDESENIVLIRAYALFNKEIL